MSLHYANVPDEIEAMREQFEYLIAHHPGSEEHGACSECGHFYAIKAILLTKFADRVKTNKANP